MSEASRVTDTYSVLAASAAVSVSEIAEAMSKTASSAYAVGASLENTATMITVMTEATRESATNIGSALKSIISRYGEMTSDPAKLVDSEGEAMSLNKVDRALQSVGISLQDAQGQFRNFDDVIAELASVWTTLDNNTQRYIATIMAGNRQQSRFLALVSSYDRYAELSEKAANAAGAGEEQFEKTLEGIEARTQQLQTSLQNLYTSAGLQDLYGSLLGIASNVLEYYNNISAAFGSGIQGAIAAVITFGTQFYNVAKIVMTVVKLIKAHYTAMEKEITAQREAAEKVRTTTTINYEQAVNDRAYQLFQELEGKKTKEHYKECRRRARMEIQAEQDAENQILGQVNKKSFTHKIGTIGTGVSLVGSIAGSMIGGTTGSGFSGIGGLVGGIAQLWTNPLGGIMSIISSIGPLVSFVTDLTKVTDEYAASIEAAQKAQEKAAESEKKAQNTKQEINNLNKLKEELEEVTRKRYNSVDSEKEYYEYMQKIAEQYPDLINYYDEEGRAIIDGTKAIEDRIKAQKDLYKQQARQAYFDKLKVDTTIVDAATYTNDNLSSNDIAAMNNILEAARLERDTKGKYYKDTDKTQEYNLAHFLHNNLNLTQGTMSYVMADMFERFMYNNRSNLSDTEFRSFFGYNIDIDQQKTNLYDKTINSKEYEKVYDLMDSYEDEMGWSSSGRVDETFRTLGYILVQRLQQAEENNENLNEVLYKFKEEFFGVNQESNDYLSFFFESAMKYVETDAYQTRLDQLREGAELFVNQLDEVQNYSDLEKDTLIEQIVGQYTSKNTKAQILGQTQEQFAKSVEFYLNNVDKTLATQAQDLHKDYYGNAGETQVGKINEALKHLGDYTKEQIDSLIEGIEETQGGIDFKNKYDNYFATARTRYENALDLLSNCFEI